MIYLQFEHSYRIKKRNTRYSREVIDEAVELVRLHEIGGNKNSDILMDADSISFFDNNLEFYLEYKGLKETRKQIDYKFNRCSSRAKKHIVSLEVYKTFIRKLKNLMKLFCSSTHVTKIKVIKIKSIFVMVEQIEYFMLVY